MVKKSCENAMVSSAKNQRRERSASAPTSQAASAPRNGAATAAGQNPAQRFCQHIATT